MRQKPAYLLVSLCLGIFFSANAPSAQQPGSEEERTAEFSRLYERWQQIQEGEERIGIAERMIAIEPTLTRWPLTYSRERIRGELLYSIGSDYEKRSEGVRADNIEKSIAAFQEAVAVFKPESFPEEWAITQSHVAVAYRHRIRGIRADNLERVIAGFDAALTVFSREAFPQDWATTRDNLGLAYSQRIQGNLADNLERAIANYESALTIFTRDAFPEAWASTQNNLGNAYGQRIAGERSDNFERAIAAFEAALTIFSPTIRPRDWAHAQNNLGLAYSDRIQGSRASNLENAVVHLQAALTIRTRNAFPREWAQTQSNLAGVYSMRVRGDRADNLERAIEHAQAALVVRTRDVLPKEWALSQINLAVAFAQRERGERGDNLEKSIAAFEAALSTLGPENSPDEWALVQSNLAKAYAERIQGTSRDNQEKSINALEAALRIFKRDTYPRWHFILAHQLGTALSKKAEWQKAALAYRSARDTFLLLFGQGLNDVEARDLIDQAGQLFAEAAFAAVQLGENEAALTLASEGRARLMGVALKLQALELTADKRRRLDELRAAIRATQRTAEGTQGAERIAAVKTLVTLRQELLGLVKDATAAESRTGSTLDKAQALVVNGGAIAVPILTRIGAKILIVTVGNQGLTVIDLPELTTARLNTLIRGDGRNGKTGGWLGAYNINHLPPAERWMRWREWTRAIEDLGPTLWQLLGGQLDAALKAYGVKAGARLYWLPTGALGILPLALVQDPASKRRLADDYEIVYAPSLQTLAGAQNEIVKPHPATLAAIINPTGDLDGAENEGAIVASYFAADARTLLMRGAATPEAVLGALKGKTYWHFASHATFSWDDARLSGLVMPDGARLTVGQLLEAGGLGRPRLVVLSACETGLYDIDRNPDEFIGLPGAFTALGAMGVLSTLWPVSDAATALLVAKFYELHMGAQFVPSGALSRAQAWLRESTSEVLDAYAKLAAAQGRLESRHVAHIELALSTEGLKRSRNSILVEWVGGDAKSTTSGSEPARATSVVRPYAHPYFWAGFIHTGM